MRATDRRYSALIHPYPHFTFSPVCPAKPRNKGQRPGLTFYRRAVVLPQGISVLRLTPDPLCLYQHFVRENAFAFKYPKRAVLWQGKVMQICTVIGLFQAVNQRPALERDFPRLLAHLRVAIHAANRHR